MLNKLNVVLKKRFPEAVKAPREKKNIPRQLRVFSENYLRRQGWH